MPNSAKTVHYVIDCSEPIFSVDDFSNLISYILPIFINEYYHLLLSYIQLYIYSYLLKVYFTNFYFCILQVLKITVK